jgi:hypothetical protein
MAYVAAMAKTASINGGGIRRGAGVWRNINNHQWRHRSKSIIERNGGMSSISKWR